MSSLNKWVVAFILTLLTQIAFAQTSPAPSNACNKFTDPQKKSICNKLSDNRQKAQRNLYSEYNMTVPAQTLQKPAPQAQQPPQVIFHPPVLPEQDKRATVIKKSYYERLKTKPFYQVVPPKQPTKPQPTWQRPAQPTQQVPQPVQPSQKTQPQNHLNIYR